MSDMMGMGVGESMGGQALMGQPMMSGGQVPWYLDMAEDIPTISQGVGITAFRGSNTILRGGHARGGAKTGWAAGTLQNNNPLNVKNWTRMTSDSLLKTSGNVKSYTPFGMSELGNMAGRGLTNESGRIGSRVSGTGVGQRLARYGAEGEGFFTRGAYSRLSAGARVANMSSNQYDKAAQLAKRGEGKLRNVAGFLDDGTDALKAGRGAQMATASKLMTSGQGAISGRIGGFASQAGLGMVDDGASKAAQAGARVAQEWGKRVGPGGGRAAAREAVSRGAAMATRKAAVGTAARAGGLAAARLGLMAVPGVNVAMAAWAAFDIAKLAVKGVGHATKSARQFGSDAKASFQGGLNTGIMQQGFRDNEVSLTSRARGVEAIQNSRLNARSVLGAEAGAMAAHFG